MGVPYTFATATTSIPLSQLDANFNTPVTIGTSTVGLGNTTTTLAGLANVSTTIVGSAGNLTIQSGSTTAMTIDTSQRVGINNTSPAYNLHVGSPTTNSNTTLEVNCASGYAAQGRYDINSQGTLTVGFNNSGSVVNNAPTGVASVWMQQAYPLVFGVNGSESARININNNAMIGTNSDTPSGLSGGARFRVYGGYTSVGSGGSNDNSISFYVESVGNTSPFQVFTSANGSPNAALACVKVQQTGSTGRSINATGTINANGADYAEYMVKAGDFTIAKGDICGIDSNGKLTNVFTDSISFVVKSTNPSYVGGDTWGIGFDNDKTGLEIARQTVDRIAFSGQVPVNVTGATAGQYIIPVNNNGSIKGEAVSNPTFEQYQIAVGKVIAIETDGRAKIIVKVA